MPTLQAFEADTLEAALARVTEEVGQRARIKQAEKVRSGGVAGFFARERYEVTVEIDDGPAFAGDGRTTTGEATQRPQPPEPSERPSAGEEPVAPSLLDLAEQVSRQERGEPAPMNAPTSRAEPRPDERSADPTTAARDCGVSPPSTEGRTFQEVLRGIASDVGLADEVAPAPAATPTPAGTSTPAAGAIATRTRTDVTAPGQDVLAALGIPTRLLAASTAGGSVAQQILSAVEEIPQPPPVVAGRGDVLVVVGDERFAVDAAESLASQVGQTLDDVVLAAPDRSGFNTLASPEDAEAMVALWRRCGVPFVVAVCPPPGPAGVSWAREMLDALDPVARWTAVGADRKPEDVALWVEQLGGADALAVGGCADTSSPAAILSTGIPVAVVEGRRSTPAAWTALLAERLSA